MGWRSLFGRPRQVTFTSVHSPAGRELEVHGESFHQDALAAIAGDRTREGAHHQCKAVLIPENNNKQDRNAIQVEVEGQQVGYVARTAAGRYRGVVDFAANQGYVFSCDAVIVGGWDRGIFDKGSFGIWLDIQTPAKLKALLSSEMAPPGGKTGA